MIAKKPLALHHGATLLLGAFLLSGGGAFAQGSAAAVPTRAKPQKDDPGPSAEDDEPIPGTGEEPASWSPKRPRRDLKARTVVTPGRREGLTFDSDRTVHVINRAALQGGGAIDLPAAVDGIPGAFLQRTNRAAGSPILRGLIGPSNLLLVDGVRINSSIFRTGPNQYAALLDPYSLERLEVLLGPASLLYGSDAMGGVMQGILRATPRTEGFGGRVNASTASADRGLDGSVHLSGRGGAASGWLGGSWRHHSELRVGGGGLLPATDYRHRDWRGRIEIDLGSDWTLRATYLGTDVGDGVRTDKLSKGDLHFYGNTDHLAFLSLGRRSRGSTLSGLQIVASYHRLEDRQDRYSCDTSNLDGCLELQGGSFGRRRLYRDSVDVIGLSAVANLDVSRGRLKLTTGLDGRMEQVSSSLTDARAESGFEAVDQDRGNFSEGSTYGSGDLFCHAEGRLWSAPGKLELYGTAGGRLSTTQAAAPDVPGLGDVEYSHSGLTTGAGLRALVMNATNIYASWSQGFRSPNLQETTVLGNTGSFFEIPNDTLGPERSDTVELGARTMRRGFRAAAAVFRTQVSDAIVREPATWEGSDTAEDGLEVRRRVNASTATYQGVEGSLEVDLAAGVSVEGTGAWIQGDVERQDGTEEPGRRIPPLTWRGGLKWRSPQRLLTATVFARGAARQDRLGADDRKDLRICEDEANPGSTLGEACRGTPGWWTLNAAVSLRLPQLEDSVVRLSADNMLDASYRHHGSGFDAPGLNVRLGASLGF